MKFLNKETTYKKLGGYFAEKPEIEFAYIFGSFPKSENYHDIDIAVFLTKDFNLTDFVKYPYGYESNIIAEITALLKTDNVDFVIMNKAGILLQQRIINNSVLLFEKDRYARIEYENYIRKLYIDAEPLRKIKKYYLSKKLNNA